MPHATSTRALSAAAIAVLLLVVASQASSAKAPEPARPVDASRLYSGVWAEIGRRPMSLTNGCVAGATRYTLRAPDRVEVRDTCRAGSPSGKEKAIGGPARILDPGVNAKLHVSYRLFGLIPVERDYWVLDHDADYTWFISTDPAFDNLWIYARDPRIGADQRAALVERAKALGYDVAKLEFPAQP
jgi:apolipoprotein D and lipocalin family protein